MSLPSTGNNSLNGGTSALSSLQYYTAQNAWYQQQVAQYQNIAGSSVRAPYISVTSPYTGMLADPAASLPTGFDGDKLAKLKQADPRKILAKVPDCVEPIVGYRCWGSKGNRLRALGVGDIYWEPKKAIAAKCVSAPNCEAPRKECQCGYWAFKQVDYLIAATKSYTGITVIGPVSLWGRVIETENGFRAQFAYPKELWLFDNSLEELGYIYGVPVRTV